MREEGDFFRASRLAKLQRGLETKTRIVRAGQLLQPCHRRCLAKPALAEPQRLERGRLHLGGWFFSGIARQHHAPDPARVAPGAKRQFAPDRLR